MRKFSSLKSIFLLPFFCCCCCGWKENKRKEKKRKFFRSFFATLSFISFFFPFLQIRLKWEEKINHYKIHLCFSFSSCLLFSYFLFHISTITSKTQFLAWLSEAESLCETGEALVSNLLLFFKKKKYLHDSVALFMAEYEMN